ncbi:MAG: molybdopterin-dependent oxidoreductase [Planctomycetota bacterium]
MSDERVIRTVCPRACYDACGMLAHVEDGRLVRVEGDPEHETARGVLCPRADRYVERVYHKDRILTPLRRVDEDGEVRFEPISWDEALGAIAEALQTLSRDHDPRSLLYYTGSGQNGAMNQFGQLFLSYFGGYSSMYGDLCLPAGKEATRLTFGSIHHHPPEDYQNSKLIVIWGKNPAVTSPHQMRFLREARDAGAKLVCIDPLKTKTARGSDQHIQPLPGTDGFLANALGHVIVAEELFDTDFIRRHVLGFDEYRRMVRQYTPEKAEEECGIDRDAIVAFARDLAGTKPVNINAGFGLQRYSNGGQTVRAVAALQAVTGNIGIAGGGFDYANQGAFLTRPYPFKLPAQPRVRQLGPVSRLGRVVLGASDPPVRAAIIERANPMTQNPFTSTVHYALTRLDFVCVIDQFLTDTARRADIILPAKTMFEDTDVLPGLWHGILQLKPKVIEPPSGVKTEREIFRALAERMAYPTDQFDIPADEMLNEVLPAGLSVNRLTKQPFRRHGSTHVPYADKRFLTPSGKIELSCEAAEVSWQVDRLPYYKPSRESRGGDAGRFKRFPLHLLTPKSEYRQSSQWGNDDELTAQEGEPRVRINTDDAKDRDIAAGDRVRIFNDRGEVKLAAVPDDDMPRGVVAMTSGKWINRDGHSVNVLTHDDITDIGYGAIFFDCLVQAELAKSPA